MTRKLTISVPDDVAERLAREPNVSAFITTAIQRQMMQETTLEMMAKAGFTFTDEDLARARQERLEHERQMTPELQAWADALMAEKASHRLRRKAQ